jgi:transcriptional regulator with GAF, ATPase, and Fis domain
VVPDLLAQDDQRGLDAVKAGYRSVLRVAIRLEGEYAAGLTFASLTPNTYSAADVPAARRIADRITLSFARERTKALAKQVDEASVRTERLESRVRALTDELNARSGYHRVIGESPSWRQVLTQAAQVGATESTVLLLGESGTGKEVVARFIHRASARARGPFAAVNCAALPEQLLEAELFGYERGAFTSAVQSKPGQFEQAGGGTLFLDEVGEMSLSVQPKFLRVLQEREFQRLGGTRVIKADIRVVAATNRDLESAITRNQFREDLFYRLNVFPIRLPPLRERRDDIVALSEAFLAELGQTLGRPPGGLSQDAKRALLDYHWPGNVRELRNLLERAAILSEGGLIVREHFVFRPGSVSSTPQPIAEGRREDLGDLKNVERDMIQQALVKAKFNKSQAAKALGITRAQLYVKLRQYDLG